MLLGSADSALLTTHALGSQAEIRKVDTVSLLEHLRTGLFLSPAFSLQSEVTYEPLRTPLRMPHRVHAIADEGLYLEQLYGKAELGDVVVYGGKFDPAVSLAADTAPGLFGGDYATDYQLREMIGGGAVLHLAPAGLGAHSLSVACFSSDTTWLSLSAFTQPNFGSIDTARTGRLHEGDGGEGNTGTPRSPMVALDGDGTALALPSLSYHLAWVRLRHGTGETKDQQDLVGALRYSADLGGGIALHPLIEASRIVHDGGSPVNSGATVPAGQRADYLTTGMELTMNRWTVSAVRAQRAFIEPVNGTGLDGRSSFERMVTTSVGYNFDYGLTIAIAWKHDHSLAPSSTLNADTDSLGLLMNWHLDF